MPGPVGPESVIASLYWQFRTRWPETRHLIVDPISSPVSCFGWSGCKAWVLSAASPWYPASPTSSHEPVLNDAFSKPHICDFVFTVHFHVTTWVQQVEPGWMGGRCIQGSHQSLSDARHFPIDLFKHSQPSCLPSQRHLQFNRFKNQNIFPQIACYRAHVGACVRARNTFLWSDKI